EGGATLSGGYVERAPKETTMGDPYRLIADMPPKEKAPMDENTINFLLLKYLIMGVCALFLVGAGTCAYTSHDENKSHVDVEIQKVEAAKAERDRAMFDSMGRVP